MVGHDRFPVFGDEITILVVVLKPLHLSCAWKHPMVVSLYLPLFQRRASVQMFIFLCF